MKQINIHLLTFILNCRKCPRSRADRYTDTHCTDHHIISRIRIDMDAYMCIRELNKNSVFYSCTGLH